MTGQVNVVNSDKYPSNPVIGEVVYDTDHKTLCWFNGEVWLDQNRVLPNTPFYERLRESLIVEVADSPLILNSRFSPDRKLGYFRVFDNGTVYVHGYSMDTTPRPYIYYPQLARGEIQEDNSILWTHTDDDTFALSTDNTFDGGDYQVDASADGKSLIVSSSNYHDGVCNGGAFIYDFEDGNEHASYKQIIAPPYLGSGNFSEDVFMSDDGLTVMISQRSYGSSEDANLEVYKRSAKGLPFVFYAQGLDTRPGFNTQSGINITALAVSKDGDKFVSSYWKTTDDEPTHPRTMLSTDNNDGTFTHTEIVPPTIEQIQAQTTGVVGTAGYYRYASTQMLWRQDDNEFLVYSGIEIDGIPKCAYFAYYDANGTFLRVDVPPTYPTDASMRWGVGSILSTHPYKYDEPATPILVELSTDVENYENGYFVYHGEGFPYAYRLNTPFASNASDYYGYGMISLLLDDKVIITKNRSQ